MRRSARLAAGSALLLAAACGDGAEVARRQAARGVQPDTGAADRARDVAVVQLGAFRDSARAALLTDSLASAGWSAYVRRVQAARDTSPPWRVRVAPTTNTQVARGIAAGFGLRGMAAVVVRDDAVPSTPTVQVYAVNRGTAGMTARVRWTHSPDRRSMLVVEDATSIENEPLPDGFLLASEAEWASAYPVLQRDSVWDVAPSPDWRKVAYGRAYLVRAEARDTLTWKHWSEIARRTNLDPSTVREGGFAASGMAMIFGFAQPVIESVGEAPPNPTDVQRRMANAIPMGGGWRVGWSSDGAVIGVGMPPRNAARDDAPPSAWRTIEVERRLLVSTGIDPQRLERPRWTMGPVIDVSVAWDTSATRIDIHGGVVEGRGGWILLRSPATGGRSRVIAAGTPLAATRDGRYIAAIAPNADARPNEPRTRAVVYQVE